MVTTVAEFGVSISIISQALREAALKKILKHP